MAMRNRAYVTRRLAAVILSNVACWRAAVACSPFSPGGGEIASGPDASSTPATDAPAGGDAAPEVENRFEDSNAWSSFDIVKALGGDATDFGDAVFAAPYVFFAPYGGGYKGTIARYDTRSLLDDERAWKGFDLTTVFAPAATPWGRGFYGGVFDGRHVYFAPHNNGTFDGFVVRYDTNADFLATTSYEGFDTAPSPGDRGAAFDGRYVYLVPKRTETGFSGVATRYDTKAPFTTSSAWSRFDTTTLPNQLASQAHGYVGAAFDGKYVYYAPNGDDSGPLSVVARYEVAKPFSAADAWLLFDATTVHPSAKGYFSAVFDGVYVYFVPGSTSSVVARYEVQKPFGDPGSWATFDIVTAVPTARSFSGGTFDGHYVYFAPGASSRFAVRFDTRAPFGNTTSWESFDVSRVPNIGGTSGTAFDGRYVYLVPSGSAVVARFDTGVQRTPPAIPPSFL